MLKTTISGTLIGEEAVEAYSKEPSSARFTCDYLGNVKTIKFDNYTISGFDIEGKEVFSYLYSYVGYDEALGFYILKTDESNAGEFTYFVLRLDTPATTYHSEFRYGSNLDSLLNFTEGEYAYWMVGAILSDGGETMAKQSIKLFVTENLSE